MIGEPGPEPRAFARWVASGVEVAGGGRARVMGILNATPDSFSDGGLIADIASAEAHGLALVADGADLLDIGGESSRPGAGPIDLEVELRRVVPAVEALAQSSGVPISVDTTKAEVARRALAAGATIVNDITALRGDPDLGRVVADSGAGLVLMHMAGSPRTMQVDPRYDDVVAEVLAFLRERVEHAERLGIARDRIAVDPGIGFGKTVEHNWLLLRNLATFASLGCVVLVGASRKGFLGQLTGRPVSGRATASAVAALLASRAGAGVLRVHDVGATVDALAVGRAFESTGSGS